MLSGELLGVRAALGRGLAPAQTGSCPQTPDLAPLPRVQARCWGEAGTGITTEDWDKGLGGWHVPVVMARRVA